MSSREKILKEISQHKPSAVPLPALLNELNDEGSKTAKFLQVLHTIGGKGKVVEDLHEVLFYLQQKLRDGVEVANGIPALAPYNAKSYMEKEASDVQHVDTVFLTGGTAVAENGAIWVTEKCMVHRILPFICQELVIVIRETDIVANMHDAYQRLCVIEDGYGVFIAGPSKTADIEQSLVIGAHGPLALQVFIMKTGDR